MGMMNRKQYAKHKLGDRVRYVTHTGPGVTKQEFAKESDINYVIGKYVRSGMPIPGPAVQAVFLDVTQIPNYQGALDRMNAASEAFLTLDPKLRERFGNEPARLVEFLQDDKNRPEAEFLGLVPKKEVKEVVPPVPSADSPKA